MEDDVVIFERLFEKTDSTDGLFVRLTCSQDTNLEYCQVLGVTFSESLGNMIPVMVVDFIDGSGDLINHNRLDTEAVYTLYFGRTTEDTSEIDFKIADFETVNKTGGRSTDTKFKVIFAHKNWQPTTSVNVNRGWFDKKYSHVVRDIVSTIGYSDIEIDESLRSFEEILQSNKPNNQMVRLARQTAIPLSEDGHYEYCGTLDNRFFFLSTSTLIENGVDKYKKDDMPLLRLGGNPSPSVREKAYKNNDKIPLGFLSFAVQERYMENVASGVTSVDAGYYDWETGSYVRRVRKYSDLNSTQLSEHSLIRENTDFVSKKVFGGRDPETIDRATNELSIQSLNMQTIHINIEGQLELHCGDIIEVLIPTGEDSQMPYSEMYSGFYMIKEIEHRMSLSRATDFVSRISLTRHGVDSKELSGYASSKNGRANFA